METRVQLTALQQLPKGSHSVLSAGFSRSGLCADSPMADFGVLRGIFVKFLSISKGPCVDSLGNQMELINAGRTVVNS